MSTTPTPQEQPVETVAGRRHITIGLPAGSTRGERRFPLTPEGAAMLAERGFDVKLEAGAADCIHFSDEAYRRAGARTVSRAEALGCDIVLLLPAIPAADARRLKTGAVLLSLSHFESRTSEAVAELLRRHVITIALDLITDESDNRPFADILAEIDGRAAMAIASSLLADPVHGKGILLGGVAAVVPCEVTVIGSGLAAVAAARTAIGLGATVRMFDNDVYSLREAIHSLSGSSGTSVIASALHPRVFASALRSADIVIATPTRHPLVIGSDMIAEMKRGVIAFDLTGRLSNPVFPGLRQVDLADAPECPSRPDSLAAACYTNAGSAVPRTAAMALTTTLMTLLDDVLVCEGISNALRFNSGLARAALTFLGKAVNADIARIAGCQPIDISLFLQFS